MVVVPPMFTGRADEVSVPPTIVVVVPLVFTSASSVSTVAYLDDKVVVKTQIWKMN